MKQCLNAINCSQSKPTPNTYPGTEHVTRMVFPTTHNENQREHKEENSDSDSLDTASTCSFLSASAFLLAMLCVEEDHMCKYMISARRTDIDHTYDSHMSLGSSSMENALLLTRRIRIHLAVFAPLFLIIILYLAPTRTSDLVNSGESIFLHAKYYIQRK